MAAAAAATAAVLVLGACSSSSGGNDKSPTPSSSSSHYTPPKPITDVSVANARISVQHKDGTLAGRVENNSGKSYRVTAITCACASKIQFGKQGTNGKLTPLVGGVAVPAHKSLEFGTDAVRVRLTGLLPTVRKGAKVPVIVYFGKDGSIQGTATVG